ncbi:MAG: hypothetical protein AMXMBFR56_06690 [Polyangiaceae bacterium]
MADPTDVPPDELVGGKYKLTRLLGRGGMGSVWEGVHNSLGTHVAVKFIETEFVDSHEARSRFENEARAAARLVSKHVVKVYDHGVMNDGRPFIVMEYLAGEPLDARLSKFGRLSLQETAAIVQQVARALTKAHEVGIVHRDLKPENVFLVRDDEDGTEVAKVVDFGIAKFTDSSSGLSSSTRTGSVLGTPYYMSPEQARGLRSVDQRSDLWSLVVIAYRCVVGALPFVGEAVGDLLVQICVAPTPIPSQKVPGIPPAFDAWIARGLAKEPGERFQTALETADALAVLAGIGRPRVHSIEGALPSAPTQMAPMQHTTPQRVEGVTAAPFTTQNTFPQQKKSPLGLFIGLGAGVLVLLGVGTIFAVRAASGGAASAESPIVAVSAPSETATGQVEAPPPEPSVAPAVEPPTSASAEPETPPVAGKTPRTTKPTTKPTTGGASKPTTGGTSKPTTGGKTGGTDVGY